MIPGLLPVEDFQLKQQTFSLAMNAAKQLVGQDPTRWGIILSTNSGGPVNFGFDGTISASKGIPAAANSASLEYHFRAHGALPTSSWYGFAGVASIVTVTEILYRPAGG